MNRRSNGLRLGFLGVGWIGLHRLKSVMESGLAEVAAIADPAPQLLAQAAAVAPGAQCCDSLEALLECPLDGLVIATPSALHADQAVQALERGVPVFCQKPLGRNAPETQRVVAAARRANRLLGVDFSYRHTVGMQKIRALVQEGALGEVFAANLVFHNAYGPDKPWFYDRRLSGGGCLIDLGIHLVDLALWTLKAPVVHVSGRLFRGGQVLPPALEEVEDYALAQLSLATGAVVQVACSWKAHTGCDAVIEASFHGTQGGASMRNCAGSFYDFRTEHHTGTQMKVLAEPPDDWGSGAILDWVGQLRNSPAFDPEIDRVCDVASVLDQIASAKS